MASLAARSTPARTTTSRTPFFLGVLLCALFATTCASARVTNVTDPDRPRTLPAEGPVAVQWDDPANFTEIRYSRDRWQAQRGDWVIQLAQYIRQRAAKTLAPGDRLSVTIHDIKRAGDYEPWSGNSSDPPRIVRDIYPPRITLSYTLTDASGQVRSEGERKLSDLAFLMGNTPLNDSDPLRYEKRLLDDWLRRDLGATRASLRS